MRSLVLFLFPVLLASCGTTVTQNEIFAQARNEIARRETWSDNATILIEQHPDEFHLTWRAVAGSFDYSQAPTARGIRVVPGTEREMRFTREGCLMSYSNPTSPCLDPAMPLLSPAVEPMPADK